MTDKRSLSHSFLSAVQKVVGAENLKASQGELIAHSRDFWLLPQAWFVKGKIPYSPSAVVYPSSTEEVVKVVKLSAKHHVPIVPYGGGSGVVGGAVPITGGLVLDMKKMNRILEIHNENLLARVQAGVNGWRYEEALNRLGFTGGHIPQSLPSSTVGGWVACRAAGQFSTKYGKIEDLVVSIEAVLPNGKIVKSKTTPRSSTGPRLEQLFLGSEGVLGIITETTLRIFPYPEKRILLSFAFKDLQEPLDAVRKIMRRGFRPAVIRLYDEVEVGLYFRHIKGFEGKTLLLFVLEGDTNLTDLEKEIVSEECERGIFKGEKAVHHWLENRFDVHLVSEMIKGGAIVDTIELATTWDKATDLYRKTIEGLRALSDTVYASGHFSHFYQEGACLYLSFAGFPTSIEDYYWKAWKTVMETTLKLGGSISHHHGVGLVRAKWIRKELGEYFELLKKIKKVIDPLSILNPGKLGWGE
ncbi:MAG: FAD-binding oxidoreductase [Candidatus Bathyarchaeota archaeon]|nr:MAG: FAD-binding oxidoreductase [Candidatus Bathyarchaeota archaeon]